VKNQRVVSYRTVMLRAFEVLPIQRSCCSCCADDKYNRKNESNWLSTIIFIT